MTTPATSSCAKPIGSCLRVALWIALAFILLFGAMTGISWWRDPTRRLRAFASEIHDYTPPYFNLQGDFTRLIRADCSEADFHRFARQEGLTTRLTEDDPAGIMSWPSCNQPWWTPPESYRGAYYSFHQGGDFHIMAYSAGHLYYAIMVW
jgi:hypothetical protein